ncbi:hypothetical protein I6F26_23735 [Ensifer sp. IC3342]|nr:hypothetical protein [Ensifer sp. BRP08]MCA1449595.1 hypothetical protein [Ensifer sp. IC3342]
MRYRNDFCLLNGENYLQAEVEKGFTMSKIREIGRRFLGRAFAAIGAANAIATAVEGNRRPNDCDLRTLGINPATFPQFTL